MEKINVFLSSKIVEISESKNYLELVNRVCYYSAPNLNSARLPYDDTTLEKAQTLVGMPVVAKYTVDSFGKPTFKGHEVSVDTNGELVFGTTPIGVHTEVYIQDDLVELPDKTVATLPCLFARQKVWKRNKNAIAAINRLYSEDRLHNSWELSVSEYTYKDGIKDITDYVFDGNCLLGTSQPAYGPSAKILSLSTESTELLVAEALSQDLIEASENPNGNEVEKMDENENPIDTSEKEVNTGGVEIGEEEREETPASTSAEEAGAAEGQEKEVTEPIVEKSDLTMWDLRSKVEKAICHKLDICWLDMIWLFPASFKAWAHKYDDDEMNLNEFSYTVENDEVTVSDAIPVVLTVSPREINSALSAKSDAIIDLNNKINELTAEIASLSPYKAAAEQAAREKVAAQRQEAIAELRKYAEKSGMLSKEELDSGEIAELINDLKETDIKVLIADRIVAKTKISTPEVASVQKPQKIRMILDDNPNRDKPVDVLKGWINK